MGKRKQPSALDEAQVVKPERYVIPEAIEENLRNVAVGLTDDLKGISSVLWAMSYACDSKNTGFTGDALHLGLHWLERELDQKAKAIEDIVGEASQAIYRSRRAL